MNNMERFAVCSKTILANVQNEDDLEELVAYMDHFIQEHSLRWQIEKEIEASEKEQEESGELYDPGKVFAELRGKLRG